jgi:hypothetical protein
MKARINNIGAEPVAYIGKISEKNIYQRYIVQYYPNRYYGELENYLKDGWEDKGTFLQKQGINLDKDHFVNKENYVVIAHMKIDPNEDYCSVLTSVGNSLLYHISEDKRNDFFEVCKIVDKMLVEKAAKDRQNEN